LKQERDRKLMDFQSQLDREKETFKAKMADVEKKYKESEQKKSSLVFEFEKEKAKWMLERDHLDS
jgi:hypothetical protein